MEADKWQHLFQKMTHGQCQPKGPFRPELKEEKGQHSGFFSDQEQITAWSNRYILNAVLGA